MEPVELHTTSQRMVGPIKRQLSRYDVRGCLSRAYYQQHYVQCGRYSYSWQNVNRLCIELATSVPKTKRAFLTEPIGSDHDEQSSSAVCCEFCTCVCLRSVYRVYSRIIDLS